MAWTQKPLERLVGGEYMPSGDFYLVDVWKKNPSPAHQVPRTPLTTMPTSPGLQESPSSVKFAECPVVSKLDHQHPLKNVQVSLNWMHHPRSNRSRLDSHNIREVMTGCGVEGQKMGSPAMARVFDAGLVLLAGVRSRHERRKQTLRMAGTEFWFFHMPAENLPAAQSTRMTARGGHAAKPDSIDVWPQNIIAFRHGTAFLLPRSPGCG